MKAETDEPDPAAINPLSPPGWQRVRRPAHPQDPANNHVSQSGAQSASSGNPGDHWIAGHPYMQRTTSDDRRWTFGSNAPVGAGSGAPVLSWEMTTPVPPIPGIPADALPLPHHPGVFFTFHGNSMRRYVVDPTRTTLLNFLTSEPIPLGPFFSLTRTDGPRDDAFWSRFRQIWLHNTPLSSMPRHVVTGGVDTSTGNASHPNQLSSHVAPMPNERPPGMSHIAQRVTEGGRTFWREYSNGIVYVAVWAPPGQWQCSRMPMPGSK